MRQKHHAGGGPHQASADTEPGTAAPAGHRSSTGIAGGRYDIGTPRNQKKTNLQRILEEQTRIDGPAAQVTQTAASPAAAAKKTAARTAAVQATAPAAANTTGTTSVKTGGTVQSSKAAVSAAPTKTRTTPAKSKARTQRGVQPINTQPTAQRIAEDNGLIWVSDLRDPDSIRQEIAALDSELSRLQAPGNRYRVSNYAQGSTGAIGTSAYGAWNNSGPKRYEAYTQLRKKEARRKELEEELQRSEAFHLQWSIQKEQAMMAEDLRVLQTWTPEEQAQLDAYIIARDRDYYNRINPMTDASFTTADMYAGGLIQKYGQRRVNEIAESLTRSRSAESAARQDAAIRDVVNKGGSP